MKVLWRKERRKMKEGRKEGRKGWREGGREGGREATQGARWSAGPAGASCDRPLLQDEHLRVAHTRPPNIT